MADTLDLDPLRNFIRREFLFDADAKLADEDPLFPDIVDSLGVMELVAFAEEHYGVTIDDSDLLVENFASLKAIGSLVGRQLDAG